MNQRMTNMTSIGVVGAIIVLAMVFTFAPASASAAPAGNAFLGGGNALARATSGESQGLAHASSTSNLLSHLTFASTRGGRPAEVPPTASTTEATSQGNEGSTEENMGALSLPENENQSASGHANGGARSGNGGSGGDSGAGGVVRAGSVVSNAQAVNVLNTVIVRISVR